VYGYVEYNSCRFGVEFSRADEDDEGEESSQAAIFETPGAPKVTDDSDAPPGESVHTPALMLQDEPKNNGGNKPGRSASARTNVAALEIDKDHLQWSAIHLRARELEKSVLNRLAIMSVGNTSRMPWWELETCALVSVCLETGRPLPEAMKIVTGNADTRSDLAFIPSKNPLDPSRWSWKALEPPYTKKRSVVKDYEVQRATYLRYNVHQVTDYLLRAWRKYKKSAAAEDISARDAEVDRGPADERSYESGAPQRGQRNSDQPLFTKDRKEYEQRIKQWLNGYNLTNRLTIGKISRLKWSLLSQECGGDIATASLVLGLPHPLANVPLYYSLLSVTEATRLFESVTLSLWKDWMEGINRMGSPRTLRSRS
jgi:hypothetical protein